MDGRMLLLRWLVVALVGVLAVVQAPWARAEGEWQPADEQIRQGELEAPVAILEVHFAYDADAGNTLSLVGMELKRGYAPLHDDLEAGYMLSLLSARGDVLAAVPFQIPNRVFNPPPEGSEEADGEPVVLRNVQFALTLAMPEAAAELVVADPQGMVVLTEWLSQLRMQYEDPDFE